MPASLAFGWLLWRRHRLGLFIAFAYLLAAMLITALVTPWLSPRYLPAVFGVVVLPALGVAMYLLVVFAVASDRDLVGRESAYPLHLLRLPVSTGLLAGWPIIGGAAAVVLLWLVFATCVLQPWAMALSFSMPIAWPAVLLMAFIAWVQALLWLPFGLPLLRIILVPVLMQALIAFVGASLEIGLSQDFVTGVLAIVTVLGWLVAYLAVRRARCGATPNWEALLRPLHWLTSWWPRWRGAFRSPAAAQLWFEWRLIGGSLPFMTVVVLPLVLLPLLFGSNEVLPVEYTLLSALGMIVLIAGMVGGPAHATTLRMQDRYAMPAHLATLPISNRAMIASMLRTMALSALAAWGIMAAAVVSAVWFTGNWQAAMAWWPRLVDALGPARAAGVIFVTIIVLLMWTWKRRLDTLYLHLCGRKWVSAIAAQLSIMAALALFMLVAWLYKNAAARHFALTVAPWLVALLITSRLAATTWILRTSLRRGLLEPRVVRRGLSMGLLFVGVTVGLLSWATAPEIPVPYSALAVLAIMPMVRLSAMPLALHWNRHR